MSRHRNIRRLYSDDYNDYDDLAPSSVDEDCAISPNTAQQFIFDPSNQRHGAPDFFLAKKEPMHLTASEFPDQDDNEDTYVDANGSESDGATMELQFDDLMISESTKPSNVLGFTKKNAPHKYSQQHINQPAELDTFSEELDFYSLTQLAGIKTKTAEPISTPTKKNTFALKHVFSIHFDPPFKSNVNYKSCTLSKHIPDTPKTKQVPYSIAKPSTKLGLYFRKSSLKSNPLTDRLIDLFVLLRRSRSSYFVRQSFSPYFNQPFRFNLPEPHLFINETDVCSSQKRIIPLPRSKTETSSLQSSICEKMVGTNYTPRPAPCPALSEAFEKGDVSLPKTPIEMKINHQTPLKAIDRKILIHEYNQKINADKNKDIINLIVVGHVDAGKSTLMGNVLYQLGQVSEKQLSKYQWEAQKLGKASFAYAWVLDQTAEERSRGVTMDIAQTFFETNSKRIILLDAPGHRDFVPQVIGGAAQADVALLVINATMGEFETGIQSGGQTQEHARLVRLLGVSRLIVVVNKMDTVGWSEARFEEIRVKMLAFLKTTNQAACVVFCPVSGLFGVNLINSTNCKPEVDIDLLAPWYDGPSLLDIIDGLEKVERPVDEPFRLVVSDIFKPVGSSVPVVAGRIVSGAVSGGVNLPTSRILCMPSAQVGVIRSIRTLSGAGDGGKSEGGLLDQSIKYAFAGDQVVLMLQGIDPYISLTPGDIICDPDNPVPVTNRIRARLLVFSLSQPITRGYPVIFYYHCSSVTANITRLISASVKEAKTRKEVMKPRCLMGNGTAEVEITFDRPICIEVYETCKSLGRFMLRVAGESIAGGTVSLLLKPKITGTAAVGISTTFN